MKFSFLKLLFLTLALTLLCYYFRTTLSRLNIANSFLLEAFLKILLLCTIVWVGITRYKFTNYTFRKIYSWQTVHAIIVVLGLMLVNLIVFLPFNKNIFISFYKTLPEFNLLLLLVIFVFPIIEELYYRNLICDVLIKKYSFVKTILLSTLIFTVAHIFADTGLLTVFFSGAVFTWIYLKTKNLTLLIVMHLFNNAINLPAIYGLGYVLENYIIPNGSFYYWYFIFIIIGFFLLYSSLKKLDVIKKNV